MGTEAMPIHYWKNGALSGLCGATLGDGGLFTTGLAVLVTCPACLAALRPDPDQFKRDQLAAIAKTWGMMDVEALLAYAEQVAANRRGLRISSDQVDCSS